MKLTLPVGSVEDLGAGVVRVTLPGAASDPNTPTADEKAALAGVGNAPPDAANPFLSYADYSLALLLAESNDAGAEPITNAGDPTDDQDLTTKKWVIDNPPGLQAVITKSPIAEGVLVRNVLDNGQLTLQADGTWIIGSGALLLTLSPDGSMVIDLGGFPDLLTIGADGSFNVNPAALSFFGATAIAQPQLPATPDAQDIADVLVALGLATQAVP